MRDTASLLHRPRFVATIVITYPAALSLAVSGTLLAPQSSLAVVWRMNPRAQLDFLRLGGIGVALMLALAFVAVLTALGLWVGTRWGWWLAVTGLDVNMVGDAARALAVEPKAAVGIPIVAAVLFFLARGPTRRWCALL